MKIFGSISELVDIAFRLAGGKQVTLLSPSQDANSVQVNIPNVGLNDTTQAIILEKVAQSISNKTINNSAIGTTTPAAGAFTDLDATTLDVTGAVHLQGNSDISNLTISASFSFEPSAGAAEGLLHSDASGLISSSKIVDADITNSVISASKFAPISAGYIYIGQDGVSPEAKAITGDVTLSATGDVQIVAGSVGDSELADDISRSKLAPGTAYRILANDASGEISENAALTANEVVATDANGQLTTVAGVDSTELGYLNGLTSNVQNQLDNKQATITGGASSITSTDLAANRALISDASGKVDESLVTSTELSHLSGVTSSIQTQLSNKVESSSLGTIASQNASSVNITGGTLDSVSISNSSMDVLEVEYNSQVVTSGNVITFEKGLHYISSFNGTAVINSVSSTLSQGALVFLKNNSGSDCSISNSAGNIRTGTGGDFDFLDGAVAPFLYDGTNWNLAGGAGAGAGGAGVSREISQSSHGFSVGDVLYFDGSSYLKARANAANTSEVVGIVSEVKDSNTFVLLSGGYIEGLSGLTAGEVHFLSSETAGALSTVEPGVVGYVSKPVLIADSASSGYLVNYRGIVVGGSNARTSLSLNDGGSTNIQDMSDYDAGELSGWVYIDATSPLRFYVEAQVSKNGAGDDYNISYQTSGDTPPSGFDMNVSAAGMVAVVLPSITGFSSANINYSLNAAAVGVDLPLSISGENILEATSSVRGTVKKRKRQKKTHVSTQISGTTTLITFNGLVAGNTYKVQYEGMAISAASNTAARGYVRIKYNSATVEEQFVYVTRTGDLYSDSVSFSGYFTAVAGQTSVTIEAQNSLNSVRFAEYNRAYIWELADEEETADFT